MNKFKYIIILLIILVISKGILILEPEFIVGISIISIIYSIYLLIKKIMFKAIDIAIDKIYNELNDLIIINNFIINDNISKCNKLLLINEKLLDFFSIQYIIYNLYLNANIDFIYNEYPEKMNDILFKFYIIEKLNYNKLVNILKQQIKTRSIDK